MADPNPQKTEAFVGKVMSDVSATMATTLAILGDRLGLFKGLAAHGLATAADLAKRTGTREGYCREWLGGMTTAGHVEYEPRRACSACPPSTPRPSPRRVEAVRLVKPTYSFAGGNRLVGNDEFLCAEIGQGPHRPGTALTRQEGGRTLTAASTA